MLHLNLNFCNFCKSQICFSYPDEDREQSEEITPMSPVSVTRLVCGALLLPTIASICGKIFFESINSNFHRTLLVSICLNEN